MRECIYCGRQLEKGEQCMCAMSVAKRRERENNEGTQKENTKEKAREQKKQEKAKQKEEKRAKRAAAFSQAKSGVSKNAFVNVWRLFVSFVRSPLDTVMNPGIINKAEIFIFIIIEGIINGLCAYSVVTGAGRGPFKMLGNLMGLRGAAGYKVIMGWLGSALSGAIGGILIFLLFCGIFYFINKFIFKQFTSFWDFARRFVFAPIPSTVIGAIGVVLGMFSRTTFIVLIISGLCGSVALIYEILRSVWYSKSASRTLYTMMAGIFVFLLITMYFVRIAML